MKTKKLKGPPINIKKILMPKKWKYYKKQEKNMHLKMFGCKMEGLCLEMQSVTESNYSTIKVHSHGTLWCLKQRGKTVLVFVFISVLPLLIFSNEIHLLFLCLSNGKGPVTEIVFVKVLLMPIFFTNV